MGPWFWILIGGAAGLMLLAFLLRVFGGMPIGDTGDAQPTHPGGQPKDSFLAALRSEKDVHERRTLVELWGNSGEAGAVSALLKALHDWDSGVRENAATALGRIGDPAAIPALSGMVKTGLVKRRDAADRVISAGTPTRENGQIYSRFTPTSSASLEAFVSAISEAGSSLPETAIWALGQIGERAIPNLSVILQSGPHELRSSVVDALVETKHPDVTDILLKYLDGADTEFRRSLVSALGKLGDEKAVFPLVSLLEKGDSVAQLQAADALISIGPPSAEPLCELLQTSSTSVRRRAARALGEIGNAMAKAPLSELLGREDNPDVIHAAEEALAQIGDQDQAEQSR